MKIFRAEINDGISDLVAATSTIAFHSEISIHEPTEVDYNAIKAIAGNLDTRDLFHLDAVLASVGWNKNDDIFDRYETWNARLTPEDKQFNYMHDEKDIIGHITKSYIVDPSGNRIDDLDDIYKLPDSFDVIMGSVLYKSWSDPDLKKRMADIIDQIEDWYVSMECLFPAFDYVLLNQNGKSEVIKRCETSAFLTKHLRAYGGSGEYNGYKIGRLLRDFSFSGVGLVKNPANPRSVILNKTKAYYQKGKNMSEQLDLDALQAELAEAKKANKEAKEEMSKSQVNFQNNITALQSQISTLEETLAAEKTAKEKMAEEMKKMKEKAAMNEEEIKKMKKEKTMMKRKAQLSDAGFAGDEIEETLAHFESLDDQIFDIVVSTLKRKTSAMKVEVEDEEDDDEEEKVKNKKTKASEEADPTEVLDSAKPKEDIAMAEDFEEEDLKTFASLWFEQRVLKTTANLKE